MGGGNKEPIEIGKNKTIGFLAIKPEQLKFSHVLWKKKKVTTSEKNMPKYTM